jgi:hypothetical protein
MRTHIPKAQPSNATLFGNPLTTSKHPQTVVLVDDPLAISTIIVAVEVVIVGVVRAYNMLSADARSSLLGISWDNLLEY